MPKPIIKDCRLKLEQKFWTAKNHRKEDFMEELQ